MWYPLSEWVICQSHGHRNRIERRDARWRTTGIRSFSWSSNLGCLALNSRRKVQLIFADTASRRWVTRAVGGHGYLLPSHKKKQVIMCLHLQKATGKQNLSWQNDFLCHLFGPNFSFLIPCHVVILTNPLAGFVRIITTNQSQQILG